MSQSRHFGAGCDIMQQVYGADVKSNELPQDLIKNYQ
jgi:hypothetical protein